MKKIQGFYLYSYRVIGFIFLIGLISSILWYGFTMLFFIGSSSWAVPIILSPNQEKVMNHMEHILIIEQNVTKDISRLRMLEQKLIYKKKLLTVTKELHSRIKQTMAASLKQYQKNSNIFKKLSDEKKHARDKLKILALKTQNNESIIDKELKVGLITKEEALVLHLTNNKIQSDLVDTKARIHEWQQRSLDFSNAANTLNGSADNMIVLYKIMKDVELENQIVQIESDIFSLDIIIQRLKKSVEKKARALSLMKKSPYIRATKKSTTVAFVPYSNLKRVRVGSAVYSCYLDMFLCYQSGRVAYLYEAEEYFTHPIFKSEIKGQLIGISFEDQQDAQKKLLFLNSKPLVV